MVQIFDRAIRFIDIRIGSAAPCVCPRKNRASLRVFGDKRRTGLDHADRIVEDRAVA
nr:hypothetical protein [uncultured Reyranella sp.]